MNGAKKQGINSVKRSEVLEAVESVTNFIKRAKADELGNFPNKSRTSQPSNMSGGIEPDFWKEFVQYSEEHSGESLVFSVPGQQNLSTLFKCDLLLSSVDLNSCYFHQKLGKCMIKNNSVIYIEVDKLSIRGSERLLGIVSDMKKLFDGRCWVILLKPSKISLPKEVSDLIDVSWVEVPPPPQKKLKMSDITSSRNEKGKLIYLEEKLKLCESDRTELEVEVKKSKDKEVKLTKENMKLRERLSGIQKELNCKDTSMEELNIQDKIKEDQIVSLNNENKALKNQVAQLKLLESKSLPQEETREKKSFVSTARQDNVILEPGLDESREIGKESALKTKLAETESKFKNASSGGILHMICRNFQYDVKFFENSKNSMFSCEIKLNSKDLEQYSKKPRRGEGKSKSAAKANAMKGIVDAIRE